MLSGCCGIEHSHVIPIPFFRKRIFEVSQLLKILPGNSENDAIDSVRIEVELITSERSLIGWILTYY